MLDVFLGVIAPVAIMVAVGAAVGRWRRVPVEPLSAMILYLFTPALVFTSLAQASLSADIALRIVAAAVGLFIASWVASTSWSTLAGHNAPMRAGFALTVTGVNSGNMGLPIALLAFGQPGLEVAIIFMVTNTILGFSAGVFIASMAGGSLFDALRSPFRLPALYAAVVGVIINVTQTGLPLPIGAATSTLAAAAIPLMLVVLGLQLHLKLAGERVRDVAVSNALRLLVSPVLMLGMLAILGVGDVPQKTLVVAAAMPTAVFTTILAREYSARPHFVTLAVATSTLASMSTLTALISLVK